VLVRGPVKEVGQGRMNPSPVAMRYAEINQMMLSQPQPRYHDAASFETALALQTAKPPTLKQREEEKPPFRRQRAVQPSPIPDHHSTTASQGGTPPLSQGHMSAPFFTLPCSSSSNLSPWIGGQLEPSLVELKPKQRSILTCRLVLLHHSSSPRKRYRRWPVD
jgi:hypothetical protein